MLLLHTLKPPHTYDVPLFFDIRISIMHEFKNKRFDDGSSSFEVIRASKFYGAGPYPSKEIIIPSRGTDGSHRAYKHPSF
jgi:hypothetical protein